jgi:DNA-binding NarL/FixJ family response regulator
MTYQLARLGGSPATIARAPAKILIVDDHPTMRMGLAAQISTRRDLEVCGEAEDLDGALEQIRLTSPALAIVDLALRESHGLELIKEIGSRFPGVKVLVLSAYNDSLYAERCLRAGALGYLNKRECQENILAAISTVLHGDRYVSPETAQRLLSRVTSGRPSSDPIERLTNREMEVFRLLGQGLSSVAIAKQLQISRNTVDSHRENIRRKLDLENSVELIQRAVQWHLENI